MQFNLSRGLQRPGAKIKGGGKRKEWKEIGSETVEAKESLREAAHRWLIEKKIIHRPVSTK